MNYSIITYIFNNYEPLREVLNPQDNVEYVLVTDNKNLKSSTWKIIYEPLMDTDRLSGISKAFYIKYNAYKYVSNEVFIRMDCQLVIHDSIDWLVEKFENEHFDIGLFQHAFNYSVYDEYTDWEYYRNCPKKFRQTFFENTKNLNYDYNWQGLFGTTMMICRKTKAVELFFNDMLDMLFTNGVNDPDINDQCYVTVLLQTKYQYYINTMLFGWTLLDSKYIRSHIHGSDIESSFCDMDRYVVKHRYWRGVDLGESEMYEK